MAEITRMCQWCGQNKPISDFDKSGNDRYCSRTCALKDPDKRAKIRKTVWF